MYKPSPTIAQFFTKPLFNTIDNAKRISIKPFSIETRNKTEYGVCNNIKFLPKPFLTELTLTDRSAEMKLTLTILTDMTLTISGVGVSDIAGVAQLVEHLTCNETVMGSSPMASLG